MAPIFFPDIIARFKCQCCGTCCHEPWAIIVDKDSLTRLTAQLKEKPLIPYPPFITLKDERGKDIQVLNRVEGRAGLAGHCVFLDRDNLCLIHKELGPQAQTKICQDFPRETIFTPKGVFLSTSFACPAALDYLKDKSPVRMGKTENPTLTLPKDKHLSLVRNIPFSWEAYFKLESSLLDILVRQEYSFEERLLVGCFLIEEIVKGGLIGSPLEAYLISQSKEDYHALFARIKDVPPSTHIQLSFLETFLKTRMKLSHPLGDLFYSRDLTAGLNSLLKDLSMPSRDLTYDRAYCNLYQPFFPLLTPILEKYFQTKLLSHHLTISFEVVRGYIFLLIYYLFIRFYSLSLAIKTNKLVDETLILEAINFLEKYFVHSQMVRELWSAIKNKSMDSLFLAAMLIKK